MTSVMKTSVGAEVLELAERIKTLSGFVREAAQLQRFCPTAASRDSEYVGGLTAIIAAAAAYDGELSHKLRASELKECQSSAESVRMLHGQLDIIVEHVAALFPSGEQPQARADLQSLLRA